MITLQKHMAIDFSGNEVEINQWQILDSGVLIGYLPHLLDSEILPVCGFPFERTDKVVDACVALRQLFDERPSTVKPPQEHLRNVLDAITKAQAEDGDE